MLKVLILGPPLEFSGGVSNYLSLFISYIEKEKIQLKYFIHGRNYIGWKNIFFPFFIIIKLIKLKTLLRSYKPNVIQINPSLVMGAIFRDFFFLRLIKTNRYPVLFFIRGWRERFCIIFSKRGFWRTYFRKRLDMADEIVVLAKQFKVNLIDLGIDEKKIHVTSTMVEFEKYFPKSKKFIEPYKILFCGNMKKEKGIFEIIEAAPIVLQKFPDSKFIFVGDGKDLDKLKRKTKKMKLETSVIFTGYRSGVEKINIFKDSHIFVFPSYTEGFPNVILEAMAAGNVLVFTPVGGLADSMVGEKNGLVVKSMPPDSKEIAEKILQLIVNKNFMIKISENNILEAKSKYSVRTIIKEIVKIYEKISNQ